MINGSSATPFASPALPAIRKSAAPLRQQVVSEMRQSIIAGRLAPGMRLTERELIAMLGVSRTVIREALRQLESEGLVAIIPNKGPVVRELSLAEAKEFYAIRAVLEGLAARLFVETADAAATERLAQAFGRVAEAYADGGPEQVLDTKNRFYEILFTGAGSATLSAMLAGLHARIWRWRALGLGHPRRSPGRSRESVAGLRALLRAIEKRDAAAAEAVARTEVMRAMAEVMRLLEPAAAAAPAAKEVPGMKRKRTA